MCGHAGYSIGDDAIYLSTMSENAMPAAIVNHLNQKVVAVLSKADIKETGIIVE